MLLDGVVVSDGCAQEFSAGLHYRFDLLVKPWVLFPFALEQILVELQKPGPLAGLEVQPLYSFAPNQLSRVGMAQELLPARFESHSEFLLVVVWRQHHG